MSVKSRNSSRKTTRTRKAIDRLFAPAIRRQARDLALRYRLILEESKDDGFLGSSLEMPGVFADGKSPGDCVTAVREALTAAIATMLELGQTPPQPASSARRQEQINIRVTPEEKLRLAEAARARGYRGISDYVRSAALDGGRRS